MGGGRVDGGEVRRGKGAQTRTDEWLWDGRVGEIRERKGRPDSHRRVALVDRDRKEEEMQIIRVTGEL
jgi:hypothetical protein